MKFNIFKRKKKEYEPRTFEGRVISDEELKEMTRPKNGTFIKREFEEIEEMMNKIRESID